MTKSKIQNLETTSIFSSEQYENIKKKVCNNILK